MSQKPSCTWALRGISLARTDATLLRSQSTTCFADDQFYEPHIFSVDTRPTYEISSALECDDICENPRHALKFVPQIRNYDFFLFHVAFDSSDGVLQALNRIQGHLARRQKLAMKITPNDDVQSGKNKIIAKIVNKHYLFKLTAHTFPFFRERKFILSIQVHCKILTYGPI